MDVHHMGDKINAKDVEEAHKKDLEVEGKHGVHYLHYWVDEDGGKIYCLAKAPSAEAARAVHAEAHGLVADEIHEVVQGAQGLDNIPLGPTAGVARHVAGSACVYGQSQLSRRSQAQYVPVSMGSQPTDTR